MRFEGVHTPLVTPFLPDGEINHALLASHAADLAAKVDGLGIGGTTGEYYALSFEERVRTFNTVAEAAGGKSAATGDAAKDSFRERCKQNPQECEQKKAEFRKRMEECRANPEKCKAEREERCKANPEKCEAAKKKMQERREQCRADPDKCRAEKKARREEFCKSDPKRCEEMKAQFEKRREECKANPDACKGAQGRGAEGKSGGK